MVRTLIGIALLGVSGLAFPQAEVLRDSFTSSGQLAYVPYYLATGSTKTRVTLRNVGPTGSYAFRVDEGRNNRIIATEAVVPGELGPFGPLHLGNYNLYMEANSSVTYEIVDTGGRPVLRKVSQSGDVCTVPAISSNGVAFLNDQWSGALNDGLGTEIERARQGTIFAIPTGMFDAAVTALVDSGNCAALDARWAPGGIWSNNPSSGLVASRALRVSAEVTIENPAWRARVPVAYLLDFFTNTTSPGSLHAAPGSTLPDLRRARHTGAVVRVQTPTGTILDFQPSTPDSFAGYLQTYRAFVNRYTIGVDPASNAVSDVVVVSQPIRRYFADFAPDPAIPPYTRASRVAGYLGEPFIACVAPPTPAGQPVCQGGSPGLVAPMQLRGAVTALRLVDAAAPPVSAPFPAVTADVMNVPATYANTPNGPASAIGFDFGPSTGTFGSPNRVLTSISGTQLIGLPVYTFMLRRQLLTTSVIAPGEVIGNPQGASGDRAGTSTASAAGLLVVGAPDAANARGEVYVFAKPVTDGAPSAPSTELSRNLVPIAKLTTSASISGDKFGQRVAISPDGGTIAIGAPLRDSGKGEVVIFRRAGANWTTSAIPFATLTAPAAGGLGVTQEFGAALAFGPGGDLAIGAPGSDAGAIDAGLSFLFDAAGGNYDMAPQTLVPTAGQASARFGTAVAVGDDRVAVGAPGQDVDGRVFVYRGIVAPKLLHAPEVVGPARAKAALDIGDKFGFGTSLDIDGPVMVVTAPGEDAGATADAGMATVFLEDANTSLPIHYLAPTTVAQEGAGTAVSVTREFVMVGAALADRGGKPDTGTSYVFDAPEAGWSSLRTDAIAGRVATKGPFLEVKPVTGEDGQKFGNDLLISGRSIVVGAPGRTVVTATGQLPSQGEVETFDIDRILRSGFE